MLRWGAKRPSTWKPAASQPASTIAQVGYDEPVQPTVARASSLAGEGKVARAIDIWEDGEDRNRIQLVAGATPLEDPFEDHQELPAPKNSQPRESSAGASPPGAQSAGEQSAGEAPQAEDPPRIVLEADPLPLSPPARSRDKAKMPTPYYRQAPATADPPCAPSQNDDRDCCQDGKTCKHERSRLLKSSIRQISLDITPRFEYNLDKTSEQIDRDRAERMAQAPSRSWKNIAGDVLAEGRLANLDHSHVTIADEAGNTVARLSVVELSEEDLCFIAAWWRLPAECHLVDRPEWIARSWVPSTFTWKASALCHKPLYFEHVGLERYGHTTGPIAEPFVSAAHFFVNIALVPYHMGISPPNECEYALGYYRPGSCAPFLLPPFPISLRGALYEAGVVTGMVFFIP